MVVSNKNQSIVGVENSFTASVTKRVIDVSLVSYSSKCIGEPLVSVFVNALCQHLTRCNTGKIC